MAEKTTIPSTPVIREVRTGSGSDSFNPTSTRRRSSRGAEFDFTPPFELDARGVPSCVPFKIRDCYDGVRDVDIQRMEKQAAKLEKDLILKELETLDFLESLASTKKVVEDLKLELKQRAERSMKSPEHIQKDQNKEVYSSRNPTPSPDLTMDVESLNMKRDEEKDFFGVASLAEELNSLKLKPSGEEDQEEVKMVTDINDYKQSRTCLRTSEMRLVAARKMEEAAKAAEALAIAEMKTLSRGLELQRSPPLTLEAHLKEDLSSDNSRIEIIRKLEEANEEVIRSKQALETALNRVEIASLKQLEAEDAFRQWNIESWKDQKAMIRAKRSVFKGDNLSKQHEEPVFDLTKPMLKRNVSIGNVLNRKQVPIVVDEKQLVTPKRKFRFIHVKVPLEKQREKQLNL